jgi:hypothetical protein
MTPPAGMGVGKSAAALQRTPSPGSPEGGQHRRTDRPVCSRGRAPSPRALQATGASHTFVRGARSVRRLRGSDGGRPQRAGKQAAITSNWVAARPSAARRRAHGSPGLPRTRPPQKQPERGRATSRTREEGEPSEPGLRRPRTTEERVFSAGSFRAAAPLASAAPGERDSR